MSSCSIVPGGPDHRRGNDRATNGRAFREHPRDPPFILIPINGYSQPGKISRFPAGVASTSTIETLSSIIEIAENLNFPFRCSFSSHAWILVSRYKGPNKRCRGERYRYFGRVASINYAELKQSRENSKGNIGADIGTHIR